MWPFTKKIETRSYTDLATQLRADWVMGRQGIADLSATVQSCVALWENGLSLATTDSALLTPQVLALTARSLALTGESVWLLDKTLIPVSNFDITTKNGQPTAYRVTIPDTGGGRNVTVLAAEVLHFKIGCDVHTPWSGSSPLRRASLSAGVLNAVESALAEVFQNAPIGSQIVPMPENTTADQSRMESSFRGKRGRVLLPESTNVVAAGGPAPNTDWKPSDLTPDLHNSGAVETWAAARHSILAMYGVLPALFNHAATGPVVREAQRHLAQWTLTPVANVIAAETSAKTITRATLDVASPLHAYDAGGRARALGAIVTALSTAKENGIDPEAVAKVAAVEGVHIE